MTTKHPPRKLFLHLPQPHARRLFPPSRKGIVEHLVWTLIWFAAFMLIFIALQSYLSQLASDTRFERIKAAHDLALTASASLLPSANLDLTLPAFSHTTQFSGGKVFIQDLDPTTQRLSKEQASYLQHDTTPLTTPLLTSGMYKLVKDGNDLLITPKQGLGIAPLSHLQCPFTVSPQRIAIDPGHGGTPPALPDQEGHPSGSSDTGHVSGTRIESDITTSIANELYTQLSSAGFSATRTRADNTPLTFQTRTERIHQGSALISIHAHPSRHPGKATITALIADHGPASNAHSTSLGLACRLINTLLTSSQDGTPTFLGGNIITIDPALLSSTDDRGIIGTTPVGVMLILNGIDLPAASSPFSSPAHIGQQLSTAFTLPQHNP